MQAEKIDKLFLNIAEIKETLVRNTVTLEEHIRRTELLEKAVEKIIAREENCPGKLFALRKTGVIETVKDVGLLLGLAVVIMQLLGVIK